MPSSPELRVIRLPEVRTRTGLSRSQLYKLESEGRFPAHIKLSERASAWLEHEVDDWIADRIAERDAKAAA
ncbi:AlpA family transcriptional regulator [Dokdonella soli]|uniref:AlpA family transcriptional regulator n=1 Tax=Dokdonella soli TaxID=529810 RepID=A0ABN1ID22_9GAMM